jgi:hypothetical protein
MAQRFSEAQPQLYSVVLPVKSYVRKYVAAVEGDPVYFTSSSALCMIVRAYLENSQKTLLSREQMTHYQSSRTDKITLLVPMRKMHAIGHIISPDNLVLINRFLEDCFERALRHHVEAYTALQVGRYKGFKDAYESFATLYGLELLGSINDQGAEIPPDITFDGLKKIDFRFRQKRKLFFPTFVPSPPGLTE